MFVGVCAVIGERFHWFRNNREREKGNETGKWKTRRQWLTSVESTVTSDKWCDSSLWKLSRSNPMEKPFCGVNYRIVNRQSANKKIVVYVIVPGTSFFIFFLCHWYTIVPVQVVAIQVAEKRKKYFTTEEIHWSNILSEQSSIPNMQKDENEISKEKYLKKAPRWFNSWRQRLQSIKEEGYVENSLSPCLCLSAHISSSSIGSFFINRMLCQVEQTSKGEWKEPFSLANVMWLLVTTKHC